jgi:hypothetical protein
MITLERTFIGVSAVVILVMFLVPPFMCVDQLSGGRKHMALGYHTIWHPPSPEFAYHALYPDARDIPNPERLAAVIPRINRVRLAGTVLAFVLALSLTVLMLRRQSRRMRA